jgi:hypothetical protein
MDNAFQVYLLCGMAELQVRHLAVHHVLAYEQDCSNLSALHCLMSRCGSSDMQAIVGISRLAIVFQAIMMDPKSSTKPAFPTVSLQANCSILHNMENHLLSSFKQNG